MKTRNYFVLLLATLATPLSGDANNYNELVELCKINYSLYDGLYDGPTKSPNIKRAPQRNPSGTYYDTVNVSFGSDLSDVSITVSRDGAEIYSDDYPNMICGEVITYSLDEAGEYTTTVYVDGERIAEETVNISE